jgi:GTP-binding protein EngB required for normal cell division
MSSCNIVPNWTSPDQLLHTAMSADTHVDPLTKKPMQQNPQFFGQEAVSQLTSDQQQELLDAVDELRRADISGKDFSIPQIIVCGDQSAGKSSVLEAISQLRFPVGQGTTTKLAIEVALRNNSSPSITPVTVTIGASASRTQEQKTHLQKFSVRMNLDDPKAFSDAVDEALNYLKLYEPDEKFWYDRLHVEISGPKQPNLTLVDLPGLIHNENQDRANPGDQNRIKNLVKSYIIEPKAIVLAVVSASNNFANQEVAQLVKEYNAAHRTMGILTKTDRLELGSEEETAAVELACDKDTTRSLGLGWHALRNELRRGGQASQPVSYEDRDEVERRFFAGFPWSQLDSDNTGIVRLRKKLSLTLFGVITQDLPNFVNLMEGKLRQCRLRHDALGAARDSRDSQLYHLQRIQRDLQSLIQDALDGRQERSDFASFFDGSPHRALRTTITRYSRKFATRMREEGKQYNIFSGESGLRDWWVC